MANLLLISLFLLNLFDTAATHFSVGIAGYAQEMNPLMGWVIEQGWKWFWGLKVGLFMVLLVPLWRSRNNLGKYIKIALLALVLLYGAIALLHCYLFGLHELL